MLVPRFRKVAAGAFRLLRDSDIEVEEDAEDLVRYFRSAIKRRRRGRVIRLEFAADTPPNWRAWSAPGSTPTTRWSAKAPASSASPTSASWSRSIAPTSNSALYSPRFPERIAEHDGDCFAAIRAKDFIVHHPYESFEVVVAFLRQAAEDPDVVAIKQTLYRAGKQSAIIDALVAAAEAGKSVTAVVELKARFDEEQNLLWASRLERAGVQVIYGFVEWKTHAKVSMVIRREGPGDAHLLPLRHRQLSSDHGARFTPTQLLHRVRRAARDAAKLFNLITGYVRRKGLELLTLSPQGLREQDPRLIDGEIANAKAGKPSAIWAKMNSLVDRRSSTSSTRRARRGCRST
jgi:polyphosphate kinase